eukprot:PLAT14314.1.p1 GENE.PLAT14314.1~~PLAT14314.1.p1  ORF type:complete len:377 (-),score=212.41 PLAT14314.1:95-1225(-)
MGCASSVRKRMHKRRLAAVPRVDIHDLQHGDILLQRETVRTKLGFRLPPSVVRGIGVMQLENQHGVRRQVLPSWTRAGFIAYYAPRDALYLLQATARGIQAHLLEDVLRLMSAEGVQFVARRLAGGRTDEQLESQRALLWLAIEGHLTWDAMMEEELNDALYNLLYVVEEEATEEEKEELVELDTVPLKGGRKLTRAQLEFIAALLLRVRLAVRRMPIGARQELYRSFIIMDDDDSGSLGMGELRRLLREMKGKDADEEDLRDLMDMLDSDGDGTVSFPELESAMDRAPLIKVAMEHDLAGIVSAELVGLMYERLGLLPRPMTREEALAHKSLMPTSFSSVAKRPMQLLGGASWLPEAYVTGVAAEVSAARHADDE